VLVVNKRGRGGKVTEYPAADARFELSQGALHESIDGEVIVIDLSTGVYYSLRGSGAEIWGILERSPGVRGYDVARAMADRYANSGADVESDVLCFVDELRAEGLVSMQNGNTAANDGSSAAMVDGNPADGFASPVLEKYTDMQDLVLIDPVHDVTTAGWPHTRPDTTPDRKPA
jgi:Coenzyme PQQ synthesis protein D (PqqD)